MDLCLTKLLRWSLDVFGMISVEGFVLSRFLGGLSLPRFALARVLAATRYWNFGSWKSHARLKHTQKDLLTDETCD